MSILVWDGKLLASDSHANDGVTSFPLEKIWRTDKNELIGGVGGVNDVNYMREWWLAGARVSEFPKVTSQNEFIVISKDRGVIRYKDRPLALLHGHTKCAFGTGRQFAYGALFAGASAEFAVRAAIKYDPSCGGYPVAIGFE